MNILTTDQIIASHAGGYLRGDNVVLLRPLRPCLQQYRGGEGWIDGLATLRHRTFEKAVQERISAPGKLGNTLLLPMVDNETQDLVPRILGYGRYHLDVSASGSERSSLELQPVQIR